jgi:hypothetical protein
MSNEKNFKLHFENNYHNTENLQMASNNVCITLTCHGNVTSMRYSKRYDKCNFGQKEL